MQNEICSCSRLLSSFQKPLAVWLNMMGWRDNPDSNFVLRSVEHKLSPKVTCIMDHISDNNKERWLQNCDNINAATSPITKQATEEISIRELSE